ncbi:serine-rich coiled-coil domain-containing protein 2 [Microcaecilia unicolor]|uniref:Serine-rich coiled-coil domain-containing protein 2 n=1 Tax=Microcaecilia unicolor TaxID=1415580 RepID=A0A6P7Y8V1_9AMPH|nr:serine-rich coiled-coil domain-containing protein 2 [Microcaecilia unicolor]
MEEKIHARTSLSSKLPRFGGIKSVEKLLKTMPDVPTASFVGTSNNSASKNYNKHSGIARMPSVSLTWRKSKRSQQNDQHPNGPPLYFIEKGDDAKSPHPHPQIADNKDVSRVNLKSSSLLSKPTKQTNMLVSPLEDLNPKSLSGLSNSTKFTKGTFLGRTSFSGPNAAKSHVNGFYTNRSTTGLQRPRNSCTNRNSSKESLMQPTASIKSSSCESIVRSQSFSHSIQNSFLPTTSLTRSHSFNRAVDLTRPHQNQHINVRTSQRSNLLSRSGRPSEVSNGIEPHMKHGFTRTYATISVSGLKKPGLSNGSGIAAPLGYRMGRPLLKSSKPLFAGEIVDNTKNFTTNLCVVGKTEPLMRNTCKATDKQKDIVETSRQVGDYIVCDNVDKTDTEQKSLNDDVDEISISSLSSSDKNDLSEDFSDDFIDLGSQNQTLQVQPVETSPRKEMYDSDASLSFKSLAENKLSHCKTDAWVDLNLSLQSKNESTEDSYENRQNTPDMNYREGSSLELSPSDSSDGTYMWDEEGMEPIGDVHPCGSYDSSEMNSLDVLNNIDSCDLEDDDLMLDVDLPEDTPYDNVGSSSMSHFERPDRNVRQQPPALWNRTTHRWSGKEHYHLVNTDHYHHGKNNLNRDPAYLELPADPVEGTGMTNLYQASRNTQMGLYENTVRLDEMTLLHMVQDCTAVKTQLLKLKRLMQQNNETESPQDIHLSMLSSPEPQSQTDDLLHEIKQLKEDAKKKDERIKQLEDLLTTKCKCCRESQDTKGGRRTHFDKYTQTPFRRSSGGYSAPSFSPWQGYFQGNPRTGPSHRRQTSSTTVFQQHPQFHRPHPGKINKNSTYRGPQ